MPTRCLASLVLVVVLPAVRVVAQTGAVDWRWLPHPAERSAAAFDPDGGRVVRFGGPTSAETWAWTGAGWQIVPVTGGRPVPTDAATFVTDSVHGRVLLFGGAPIAPPAAAATWAFDSGAWQLVDAGASAAPAGGQGCYDSTRDRLVWLAEDDVWVLEATGWRLASTGGIPRRTFAAIAYDPLRDRVVVHGGFSGGTSAETWEWDGANWQRVATGASGPGRRAVGAMVWDASRGLVLLHGGSPDFATSDTTWGWDGAGWTAVATGGPRQLRANFLVFDPTRDVVVCGGGYRRNRDWNRETWELSASGWARRHVEAWPTVGDTIATEPDTGHLLVVGSAVNFDSSLRPYETWRFSPSSGGWSELASPAPPRARLGGVLVPHRGGSELLLWGGRTPFVNDPPLVETYSFAAGGWTRLVDGPSPRSGHAMAYDSDRDVVVLFGGVARPNVRLDETWEWDGNAWTRMTPTTSPPAREGHGLAYDAVNRRVVLHGGRVGSTLLDDTWAYDGTTWTELATTVRPSAFRPRPVVYDATRERVVMLGGPAGAPDVHELVGDDWQRRRDAPPALHHARAATFAAPPGRSGRAWVLTDPFVSVDVWSYGPAAGAAAARFGDGCPTPLGRADLVSRDGRLPSLGASIVLDASGVGSPSLASLLVGTANAGATPFGTLPVALGALGFTGCFLGVTIDAAVPMTTVASGAEVGLTVPGDPGLLGVTAFAQAVLFAAGLNPAGAVTTNGLELVVGAL